MKELEDLQIPLCYYPTTVFFLDDSSDYLSKLLIMFNDIFPCLISSNPEEAMTAVNKSLYRGSFVDRCKLPLADKMSNQLFYKVDLKEIKKEVLLPDRFGQISIVVIDYSMPSMNGLDFCRKFSKKDVLFFLLTGEADEQIAIQAFSEGLISGFMKKSNHNLRNELPKIIDDLQHRYFLSQSHKLLSTVDLNAFDFLKNEDIAKLLNQICKENQICEFYLISDIGDFMLINEGGDISFLSVKHEKNFQNLYEQADIDEAPIETLNALKNMEKIPIFYDCEDNIPWAEDWAKYLCVAKKIPGNNDYYFAYLKDVEKNSQNILPYQHYLFNR